MIREPDWMKWVWAAGIVAALALAFWLGMIAGQMGWEPL